MSRRDRPENGAPRLARRQVIQLIAAAAAAPVFWSAARAQNGGTKGPKGTPTDPDLIHPTQAWELKLTDAELEQLKVLCDLIIPADARSPAASAIGAPDFIDEWVSAPYPAMAGDLEKVRKGLAWLETEAGNRFNAAFGALDPSQQHAICDDICHPPAAKPEHVEAAWFFDRVRMLTAMAFYTTREGMADIQYVGNVPMPRWDPPPEAALKHVGLI